MNIKEKIEQIAKEVLSNSDLLEKFKDEPIKFVEKKLGVDLPNDIVEKIVDGIKAAIAADKASDMLGAFKKLF